MTTIVLPSVEQVYEILTEPKFVQVLLNPNNSFEYRVFKLGEDTLFKFLAMNQYSPDPVAFVCGLMMRCNDSGRQIVQVKFEGMENISMMWFTEKAETMFMEFRIGKFFVERKSPKQIIAEFPL